MSQSDQEDFIQWRHEVWAKEHKRSFPLVHERKLRSVWASKYLKASLKAAVISNVRAWDRAEKAVLAAEQAAGKAENYHEEDDEAFVGDYNLPSAEDYRATLQCWQRAIEQALPALRSWQKVMAKLDFDFTIKASGCDEYVKQQVEKFSRQLAKIKAAVDELPEPDFKAMEKRDEARRIAQGILGSGWIGQWPLGGGSFGTASLHVKQDASGHIVDRIVIKNTVFKNRTLHVWNWKELWTDDGGPKDLNSIPIEIQAMKNLRNRAGSGAVVNLRNWRLSRQHRSHRQYQEFCPSGDAFGLMTLEPYLTHNNRRRLAPNTPWPNAKLLPEPFIWFAFWNLVIAGLLMERGALVKNDSKSSDWAVIVHRDMKPSNVFLGPASATHFRCYPEPKVGDFGLAVLMRPEDPRPAGTFTKCGTAALRAPEQAMKLKTARGETKKMSSKTNPANSKKVFGIGITIWSLVQGREGWDSKLTNWDDPRKQQIRPVIDRTAQDFYSKDLLDLIDQCLKFNDDDRPTMDELMYQIRQFTGDGPVDHAQGLRDAAADDPAWAQYKINKDLTKEKFAVGAALNDLPPRPDMEESLPSPPPLGKDQGEDDLGGPEGKDFFLPAKRTAKPRSARPKGKTKAVGTVDAAPGAANSLAPPPNKRRKI